MIGDKKGLPLIQNRRVSLSEYNWLVGPLQRPMQFLIMCGIVHANGKNLHTDAKLANNIQTAKEYFQKIKHRITKKGEKWRNYSGQMTIRRCLMRGRI